MNIDTTFGVHRCAWEVLASLQSLHLSSPHFVRVTPWYNGRERGFVFQAGRDSVLNIAVFEHRNSDGICALRWETPYYGMNPPTIASDGHLAYPNDDKFGDIAHSEEHDGADDMAAWIYEQFKEHMEDTP